MLGGCTGRLRCGTPAVGLSPRQLAPFSMASNPFGNTPSAVATSPTKGQRHCVEPATAPSDREGGGYFRAPENGIQGCLSFAWDLRLRSGGSGWPAMVGDRTLRRRAGQAHPCAVMVTHRRDRTLAGSIRRAPARGFSPRGASAESCGGMRPLLGPFASWGPRTPGRVERPEPAGRAFNSAVGSGLALADQPL